ncbi:YczE/YyaS/YitT family protein [Streptococcus porci]|uniref:YczE/YyaS/YitT family protein n=1 Tax=Streptococcus porci TaxID=502567 RepID=UPI00040C3748|nr:DUF6198 family protein [Streptococcus porci]
MKKRFWAYLLGNIILALGICLNAKANLGMSAIMAIPYGLTDMMGIPIGITSFAIYTIMVVLQLVLLGKHFAVSQWLQLVSSFISSLLLQIFDSFIQGPQLLTGKVSFLLIGILLTAIGASLTIVSELFPGAPDGLANAIGISLKKGFGIGKNLLDAMCVLLAAILGLATGQGLLGMGIGTIVAVVLTGQIISLVHPISLKMVA